MVSFNYNGKLFEEGEPVIGADNRGLRYGDGLFETIKLMDGRLLLEEAHFKRLWWGMNKLQFEIPDYFNPLVLKEQVIELAVKNNHHDLARIRLTIIRGNGSLHGAVDHAPGYIIQTWPLPEDPPSLDSNGIIVGLYDGARKSCDSLSNIKHNNYLPYAMAALYAKHQNWHDAFLLNSYERICDSTIANIFLVKDDKIFTPSLQEGCIAGVMRGKIIKELRGMGWRVNEIAVTVEDIMDADELFLSNSMYIIRWVQSFSGKIYGNTITHKIYADMLPTILQHGC